MSAETWIAVAAAATAAAALYFNGLATRAAVRAAKAAEEQTDIQRQLRIDAAQPYVWVDVRPDDSVGTLLTLVVGNSGPTVATNIKIRIEPPLPSIRQLEPRASEAQARLEGGLVSLAPGRTMVWPLGQGFNLLKDDVRQVHTLTVTCEGLFGRVPALSYAVDLSEWRGVLDRPAGSLHQLTVAVKDLAKMIDQNT
jgi:hypothetical protein